MTNSANVIVNRLPQNLSDMLKMPEAAMRAPEQTAFLTVAALCAYAEDRSDGLEMLNYLRGSRPLGIYDQQFLADRFKGQHYIPFSYLGENASRSLEFRGRSGDMLLVPKLIVSGKSVYLHAKRKIKRSVDLKDGVVLDFKFLFKKLKKPFVNTVLHLKSYGLTALSFLYLLLQLTTRKR